MLSSLTAEMAPYEMNDMRREAEAQHLANSARGVHAGRGATALWWLGHVGVALNGIFRAADNKVSRERPVPRVATQARQWPRG
jgi:hypothetical protein